MESLTVHTADELVAEWQAKSELCRRATLRRLPGIRAQLEGEAYAYDVCAAQLGALLNVARTHPFDGCER